MRTRFAPLVVVAALLLASCSDDAPEEPTAQQTTDAECSAMIPDAVFTTLGWTPTVDGGAITVRGCRRQAPQGYIEVRRRSASFETVCATLDRTGTPGPGVPAPWLGDGVKACAVEPDPVKGQHTGQTKVVVSEGKRQILQIFVAALSDTPPANVRTAVTQLLEANPKT